MIRGFAVGIWKWLGKHVHNEFNIIQHIPKYIKIMCSSWNLLRPELSAKRDHQFLENTHSRRLRKNTKMVGGTPSRFCLRKHNSCCLNHNVSWQFPDFYMCAGQSRMLAVYMSHEKYLHPIQSNGNTDRLIGISIVGNKIMPKKQGRLIMLITPFHHRSTIMQPWYHHCW